MIFKRLFLIFAIFFNFFYINANPPSKIIGIQTKGNYSKVLLNDSIEFCKVMHITDSHITIPDESDSLIWDKCRRMHTAYENTHSHIRKKNITRSEAFKELISIAKKQKVDLILLTGDIINFPSRKTVKFVHELLTQSNIPYLYIAGNHDWHLEGTSGSSETLRKRSFPILKPLYQGRNPLYNSTIIKGINFVCIDNSTYQINKQQLRFFKREIQKGYPIVLSIHIPVYTTFGTKFSMGNPSWGAKIDNSYIVERREKWSEKGNNQETIEFHQLLMTTPNIIVLSGHIHVNVVERENNLIQFITGLSRDGYYRIFEFNQKKIQ